MDRRRFRLVLPGALPRGLIGMLVLMGLFEVFLDGHMPDILSESPHCWWWSNWAATRPAAVDSEILSFGSSLMKHGVAPTVIQTQTGRSMWNLSVLGGRPTNAYYSFRRALAAGARPKAIVLDTELICWAPPEALNLWAQTLTPVEGAELALAMRDSHFFASFACNWLLPSVRCRYEIRTAIKEYWKGGTTPYRNLAAVKDRNWKVNRGVTIQPSTTQMDPNVVACVDALPPEHAAVGRWEPVGYNVAYLDRLLDLAAERQIPVFWVLPPRYKTIAQFSERPNWHGLQREFVRERVARYPNLTVIDGLLSGYGPDALIDAIHVNRRGAVAWSLALGGIIRDRLAGPLPADPNARWVELPRFAEPPAETLVEDTAESAGYLVRRTAELAAAAAAAPTVRR